MYAAVRTFDQPPLGLLDVELLKIAHFAAEKEPLAHEADHPLDAAFGFGPRWPAGFGNELMSDGKSFVLLVPDDGFAGACRIRTGALASHRQDTAVAYQPERDVNGSELLTSIFQGWPSFHDAEILCLSLRREPRSATLQCTIHISTPTDKVDADGYFVHTDHTLATIRFDDIEQLKLEDFNHQNAIDDLKIESDPSSRRRFVVDIPANNGCDAKFSCDSVTIVSAEPYTSERRTRDDSVHAGD